MLNKNDKVSCWWRITRVIKWKLARKKILGNNFEKCTYKEQRKLKDLRFFNLGPNWEARNLKPLSVILVVLCKSMIYLLILYSWISEKTRTSLRWSIKVKINYPGIHNTKWSTLSSWARSWAEKVSRPSFVMCGQLMWKD